MQSILNANSKINHALKFSKKLALGPYIQYSSQVMSPAGTCKCHNGTPRGPNAEMPCARPVSNYVDNCQPSDVASIFSRQQGPHECTQACWQQQPVLHCSYSHLRTIFIRLPRACSSIPGACSSRGSSYHIFRLPQAAILKSAWTSAWTDWVPTGVVYCLIFLPTLSEHD